MLRNVEASIEKADSANLAELDLDRDGVISREELMTAMRKMKTRPDDQLIFHYLALYSHSSSKMDTGGYVRSS